MEGLQPVKRKVTMDLTGVGGPVDVKRAALTSAAAEMRFRLIKSTGSRHAKREKWRPEKISLRWLFGCGNALIVSEQTHFFALKY